MKEAKQLGPTEIGLLRGGRWAAAQTALAMLAARGRLIAGPPGRIRRTGVAPSGDHMLERALFSDLYGTMGARELANQPRVRQVVKDVELRLVRQGYLRARSVRILLPVASLTVVPCVAARPASQEVGIPLVLASVVLALWFLPRRTWSGSRALNALRARNRSLATMIRDGSAAGYSAVPDKVGFGVALFGRPALLAFLPTFAADAGLLDGGKWTRRLDFPEARRGRWR
ncbi:TIGR04222 domain-containing membrane protein [Rugosimonospora africana]|uniref:TIGR04222 domain-containing protein n=1 Tax=Rugosimonospora africana TaxID=556532 RepID=A0A8J3QPE6_9ACTN|nr:TIGR04222 domain-containing membrane protein [Rugosimonospora africana]GIH12741.1 hypothetical protein Raf01_09130 [Rugosimonospora africana]